MADLRYPIGEFQKPSTVSASDRGNFIRDIAAAPDSLRAAVAQLDKSQLDTPYRPSKSKPKPRRASSRRAD